jgi:hypothetical protein
VRKAKRPVREDGPWRQRRSVEGVASAEQAQHAAARRAVVGMQVAVLYVAEHGGES